MAAASYHPRISNSKYGETGKTWDTPVFPACTCIAVSSALAVLLKIQFRKALAISNFVKGVNCLQHTFKRMYYPKHLLHESAFMFRVFQNEGS